MVRAIALALLLMLLVAAGENMTLSTYGKKSAQEYLEMRRLYAPEESTGIYGPFDLIGQDEIRNILKRSKAYDATESHHRLNFTKNYLVKIFKLKSVQDILTPLLGKKFYLWEARIVRAVAGHHHRWHIDVQHQDKNAVTFSIALESTDEDRFKFITHSRSLLSSPQEEEKLRKVNVFEDKEMARAAIAHDPRAELMEISLKPGQVVYWRDRVWHSTQKPQISNLTRRSLIYQVSTKLPKVAFNFEMPVYHSDGRLYPGLLIEMP